ncbi:hypothetical protein KKH13_00955 [Patescibacteria group bacterium]|nr:hypothetical protein [Patescibacteria group bacterium]
MNRDQALKLVNDWTKNPNLVKHMLAVEAQMRALAKYFKENEEEYGLAGLIHDADYDQWPQEHPQKLLKYLEENQGPAWLISAVRSHAWGYHGLTQEPTTKLEWSLYCSDELSGLIIACALVRPEKKLAAVKVENVLKKWPEKSFAAGVHREQIEFCEEKLGVKLPDFIAICLKALQDSSDQLGL